MSNSSMLQRLSLQRLTLDADIQPRETMSSGLIVEYAKLYREGHDLPPIKAFREGRKYWVADGFHRTSAAREAGLSEIAVDVEPGTKRDAILYACSSNKHGKARTNDDKRRAVTRLLKDVEWQCWGDREIATHCGVDHKTVAKYRRDLSGEIPQIRVVERGRTRYEMDTSRIGQRDMSPVEIEAQTEPPEFTDDMDRNAIEAAFPEQPSADIFDALDGLDDEAPVETDKNPLVETQPEPQSSTNGGSSYVEWVRLLRDVAILLERIHQLGGIATITKNLTSDQVDTVIKQVHRLNHHISKLVGDVEHITGILDIETISR